MLDIQVGMPHNEGMPTYAFTFACDTCFDTETIDQGGREIPCPDCPNNITIKVTGLGWCLGLHGCKYATVVAYTASTITFVGTAASIRRDVANVRVSAVATARAKGLKGRNAISSGAIAIERRVLAAL